MSYDFKSTTVLVVDGSPAMLDLIKSVLFTFGIRNIYSASSSAQGFKIFCQENPDLVIVDWLEDPDNGLNLTQKIRKDPKSPNPFVPIIMMTGYSQKKRVVMARDSGITEFMAKPFTAKALYERIEQIIEKPRQFVKAVEYFGPDRRRKTKEHSGSERRGEKLEEANNKKASKTAKAMRERREKHKDKE